LFDHDRCVFSDLKENGFQPLAIAGRTSVVRLHPLLTLRFSIS
jgi:hypothetical protein